MKINYILRFSFSLAKIQNLSSDVYPGCHRSILNFFGSKTAARDGAHIKEGKNFSKMVLLKSL